MFKNIYFSQLILLLVLLFTLSCSDSKPERLLVEFSDDFNTSTIDLNREIQINVYAEFDDASKENVTKDMIWSSSDTAIATVDDGLLRTNTKSGSVEISYRTESSSNDTQDYFIKKYKLSVKELQLIKIELSENGLVLYKGDTHTLQAQGVFEDNITSNISYQDITNDCEWVSANDDISSVNNIANKGLVTAISIGSTTITASNLKLNASASIDVKEVVYTQLEIYTSKTTFNVQQTILLKASALTSSGQKVVLGLDEVEWSSKDSQVVSVEEDRATAKKTGETIITATLKSNTSLTDTITLSVDKDEYVRLFKNGTEVEFPFAQSSEYTTLPVDLDSFTLRAVGKDFAVSNLIVKDFNLTIIDSSDAYFDSLSEGEILSEDVNLTYTLIHSLNQKELHYFYSIDDLFSNNFSQKYKELD